MICPFADLQLRPKPSFHCAFERFSVCCLTDEIYFKTPISPRLPKGEGLDSNILLPDAYATIYFRLLRAQFLYNQSIHIHLFYFLKTKELSRFMSEWIGLDS